MLEGASSSLFLCTHDWSTSFRILVHSVFTIVHSVFAIVHSVFAIVLRGIKESRSLQEGRRSPGCAGEVG